MEMLSGFLLIVVAVAFAYIGLDYCEKFLAKGWRPSMAFHKPSGVSRSEAAEDQPGWLDYAASLRDRDDK